MSWFRKPRMSFSGVLALSGCSERLTFEQEFQIYLITAILSTFAIVQLVRRLHASGEHRAPVVGWWFETTRFQKADETEEEVNPGKYGESLARWAAKELSDRHWTILDQFPEDWGWFIHLTRGGYEFYVACGNEDGTTERWMLIPTGPGLIRRLWISAAYKKLFT